MIERGQVRDNSWPPLNAWATLSHRLIGGHNWRTRLNRLSVFRMLILLSSVSSLERSPDGSMLASASALSGIRLSHPKTLEERGRLHAREGSVIRMTWSPDGKVLASAVLEGTVQLWDSETGVQTHVLEGHTDAVVSVAFSNDGRLFASRALDNTVRLWRCDTWEPIAVFYEQVSGKWFPGLAFHPHAPVLATLGEQDTVIRIWNLDPAMLLSAASVVPSIHYTNAKVVLLGDSGVGKSGLALVLSGDAFQPTESTHGRRIWTFDRGTVPLEGGQIQTFETLLWDLAGQPGYRLIHQLHLSEVAVALVVFDARSETDPFSGVRHWDRALRAAQRVQGNQSPPLAKFLVAARADRGGAGVSSPRIKAIVRDLGFKDYFETSAKENWGIEPLAQAVRQVIDWAKLPSVSSSRLFQQIKDFLLAEKKAGRLLSTADDLFRAFLGASRGLTEASELHEQFEVCIGRVEARGLIRRLSFGGLILLQPELLDAYASALVNTAKDEPDGLGCMAEEDARVGRFRMSEDEKIKGRDQERLLLIATVEELLWHEIALREQADDGSYLVFPSQLTREWPDAPDPEGKGVVYEFEGPVQNVYATLAVRLSRSGLFAKKAMWKNAASYAAIVGGTCGIYLREIAEGHAEMIVFYDKAASKETRFQFEEYVHIHLQRRALRESISRRYVLACPNCGETFPDRQVQLRRGRGLDWINCSVCDTRVSLTDYAAPQSEFHESRVPEMDLAADAGRERATVVSMLQGKIETRDFDVFLCHKSEDKPAVKEIGNQLKDLGILPWLDEWELRPGLPWQRLLEEQIGQIKSVAVFVGRQGIGPWQQQELEAFLREFVNRSCPVIPVLLPDAPEEPQLPIFLRGYTWVDFRRQDPDPLELLIWGITGIRRTL